MDTGKASVESLKNYEILLNDIQDGVGETDLKGNMTFINDAGCRIWGYSREEIIGTNYRSYVDAQGVELLASEYGKIYRTGNPGRFVHEVIRKDGTRRIVEDSVSLIRDAQNNITGFRTIQRDVTEREETQQKLAAHRRLLEAIYHSVKDAIITVDLDLKVIGANQSTETICGLNVSQMDGRLFSDCLARCNGTCAEVLKQALHQKTTIAEYRIECGHQLRNQQLVSVSSSPLLDSQDNFTGAVLVIRDITLLNDLERELRQRHKFQNMIGRSEKMQNIYRLLEDLANLDTTVLVTGESGTGKELVARALHYSGQRAFRPFVTVNCSALAENLLESELFGHVRGAFTGAVKDKQGRFEAAEGGTILLDEIGDISPLIQLKLLRVLQEKTFERVGESVPRRADVRVIASTNKHLRDKVKKGEFREDLYYRLMVVEVPLPPLRERQEDVPILADYFISVFNQEFRKNIEGLSRDVLQRFMQYAWPGNVRELEHALEHAFILCRGRVITLEHLPEAIRSASPRSKLKSVPKAASVGRYDEKEILDALGRAGGNKAKAARLMGVNRRTIYRWISKIKPLATI